MSEQDPRPGEDHVKRTHSCVRILLPALREVARRLGYALAVHGSLERDIDLIAVPWRDGAVDAPELAAAMFRACEAIMGFATWPGGWTEKETWDAPVGSLPNPSRKPYGRLGWMIILSGGPYIDLSVTPRLTEPVSSPVDVVA